MIKLIFYGGVNNKKEKKSYLKSSPQPSQITVEGTFEPL
jgi:hypothetical protein